MTLFKYKWVVVFSALFFSIHLRAQSNSDSAYQQPLKQVLEDIQQRYQIKIKYPDSLVAGKTVRYAAWRFRDDAEATLTNVLSPLDMKVRKDGEKSYRLGYYEYYRWPVEEGWAELDRIASKYNNVASWETRKNEIRPCLWQALELGQMPAPVGSPPVITPTRNYNGYTVQNIAIEILPGIWVNGSLYKPARYKGKIPVILNPDGHWEKQRYRPDCQYRCAAIARMGAMAFSYDLFAWGESLLQFKTEDHRRSLSMTMQVLGTERILDYLLSLKDADTSRVGIAGGSGAGSHCVLLTALDNRIRLSCPVVSLSSYFYGGCPCESGMPIHDCGGRTDNVELAAMAAPRPQLLVSDGGDWTDRMPEHDFPYLRKIYSWYGKVEEVQNVHLPDEKHDFGINKRTAVYQFLAKEFGLNIKAIEDANGKIDESSITIEQEELMYVFGPKGEKLPPNAVRGFDNAVKVFNHAIGKN